MFKSVDILHDPFHINYSWFNKTIEASIARSTKMSKQLTLFSWTICNWYQSVTELFSLLKLSHKDGGIIKFRQWQWTIYFSRDSSSRVDDDALIFNELDDERCQ